MAATLGRETAPSQPGHGWGNGRGRLAYVNRFDSNRHWLPNGGVAYCDCEKIEICTAETMFPSRYAAQHIASLVIAEQARQAAEADAPDGTQIHLTAENVDPEDPAVSWGTHFNASISRALWENLHLRNPSPERLLLRGLRPGGRDRHVRLGLPAAAAKRRSPLQPRARRRT